MDYPILVLGRCAAVCLCLMLIGLIPIDLVKQSLQSTYALFGIDVVISTGRLFGFFICFFAASVLVAIMQEGGRK